MARDSEVNADKLGNEASAVFVVRSGSISRQGGELELHGALEEELMDCREPREFTVWRNQVQTGMFTVIRLKITTVRFF